MYDKAFIMNVNKCPQPFFLGQHIDIVNRVTLQSFWYISKYSMCSLGASRFEMLPMDTYKGKTDKFVTFIISSCICM